MADTQKRLTEKDASQTLQASFNEVDYSLTIGGFLTGKVGRKIVQSISTTTLANDTATFDFQESGVSLYQLQLIYTDGTQSVLVSAERIS